MPPHTLALKLGAIVILLRNLNTKEGLCNGTRMVVKELKKNVIVCEVLTGSASGTIILLPRITLAPINPDIPFILQRHQFPIQLAFSMTINKAQGQTLTKVGIFLKNEVFTHGQLYVAFSRVRQFSDVKVGVPDNHLTTANVVYKEIFQKK